jgi:hypothetical protein
MSDYFKFLKGSKTSKVLSLAIVTVEETGQKNLLRGFYYLLLTWPDKSHQLQIKKFIFHTPFSVEFILAKLKEKVVDDLLDSYVPNDEEADFKLSEISTEDFAYYILQGKLAEELKDIRQNTESDALKKALPTYNNLVAWTISEEDVGEFPIRGRAE